MAETTNMPQAGDRYRKDGKTFTVQFVARGQVYGYQSRPDRDHVDYIRVSLADFWRDANAAERS